MSFTMLLLLAYIVMGVGSFIAFKRKHKAIGIALLLVIAVSYTHLDVYKRQIYSILIVRILKNKHNIRMATIVFAF